MRYGKGMIALFTAFLISMVLAVLILCTDGTERTEEHGELPLLFSVRAGETEEQIRCWKNPEGEYVVFLPGYAHMDDVRVASAAGTISIGDRQLTDGMSCSCFDTDREYTLVCADEEKELQSRISFVRSGAVPTLYMDVSSGNMDYIHMDKRNEETGFLRLYAADGIALQSAQLSAVKGRGNTSWYAEKKPYNLTLAEDADLLGMGAARRWVLLAEGSSAVNIRNKLVCDFADAAGLPYSPDCAWVDLYLNGEYSGLYLLCERNEIHPERVDIAPEGSFLISMESKSNMDAQKIPYIDLGSDQVLRIRESSVANQELHDMWSGLLNALLAEDGRNPVSGEHWTDMADLDSWVRKYLLEEIFANPDGGVVSQYFYMNGSDPDRKIAAGPAWDYDYSMGGEQFWMRNYPSFMVMLHEYTGTGMYRPWFAELYRKDLFYTRLKELYRTEFCPLMQELTRDTLDEYTDMIWDASVTNGIRWGYSEEDVRYELAFIRRFLENRMSFLSEVWIEDVSYHTVQVDPGRYTVGYILVRDGETLPALPDIESMGAAGWYDRDTEEAYDITAPVFSDARIYVKKAETGLPMIHYAPIAALLVLLPAFVLLDGYRRRKERRKRNDAAKVT